MPGICRHHGPGANVFTEPMLERPLPEPPAQETQRARFDMRSDAESVSVTFLFLLVWFGALFAGALLVPFPRVRQEQVA